MVVVKQRKIARGRIWRMDIPIATRKAFLAVTKNFDKRTRLKVRKALESATKLLKKEIAKAAPKKTGDLRKLIKSLPINAIGARAGFGIFTAKSRTIKAIMNIGTQKHRKILWVNNGTGLFGPNKKLIVPVKAKTLKFKIGKKVIFSKFVVGQKGQKFIQKGIKNASTEINRKIIKAFTG